MLESLLQSKNRWVVLEICVSAVSGGDQRKELVSWECLLNARSRSVNWGFNCREGLKGQNRTSKAIES